MRLLVSGCTATFYRIVDRYRDCLGALVTPSQGYCPARASASGLPWGVDNAAFSGFDPAAYRRLLGRVAGLPGCRFVAAPDVVADARATLALWPGWLWDVRATGHPPALVGQDGAEDLDLPWADMGAYFIGGSTGWKLSQASADLAAEAKRRGLWVHMGRVNSRRRLTAAFDMGCHSVDGTGMSKWGDRHLANFCRWLRDLQPQPVLFD